jgi:hypothetical protein
MKKLLGMLFTVVFALIMYNNSNVTMTYLVTLQNPPAEWNVEFPVPVAGGELDPGEKHALPRGWDNWEMPEYLIHWMHKPSVTGEIKWELKYLLPPETADKYDIISCPNEFMVIERGQGI